MDKEMRERIRREQQALKKEEIENMKAYFEEWERDPVWMRRREIKKAIFIIIFISNIQIFWCMLSTWFNMWYKILRTIW